MASTIANFGSGITALTNDNKIVMSASVPYVDWGFSIVNLENWLTTLEEAMTSMPPCHRSSLEGLYFSLKAAHKTHQKEHEELISDAPTEDDLAAYLTCYAAAMARAQ